MKTARKTFLILAGLCGLALAVMGQQSMNNGTSTFSQVSSNGGTVFAGGGETYLALFNAGSNTIVWAFGSTLNTTNQIFGNTTNTPYIGETLNPGATKTFDKSVWNPSDIISARTTNTGNGWLVIHHGY